MPVPGAAAWHPATHNIPTTPATAGTSFCGFGIVRSPCSVFALEHAALAPSPSMPSSLSSSRVVCILSSVASTAVSALGAAPTWLGEGGGMWILRGPFVVTSPSSLFRLCAMCELGAHPSLGLLPGILQPTTSRRLQQLMVCRTLALALSVRLLPFSLWSPVASSKGGCPGCCLHRAIPHSRCVFCSQHSCCLCAWCCPHVAWGRGFVCGSCEGPSW
jgi:hypothetical protein